MKVNIHVIIRSLLVSGCMLLTVSCSDSFFQVNNPNQVSEDTYWQTEDDALMALAACYDALQSDNLYDDYIDADGFGFLMRETSTDNGHHSWGSWMVGSNIARGTSSTADYYFPKYWNANYELIKRCNMLIANIDRIPMTEEQIGIYKAEAIALRALGYTNLISVFRDVPYLDKPLTLKEAEAPKTLKTEIVNAILADMEANNPKLPAKGSEAKGRMSQEAAYAIMGRIALFDQRWEKAIAAYGKVVGKVQLFKSGDGTDYAANFADLFTVANETCDEVLLSVHFRGPGLGEGSTFGICWSAPMNAIEGSMNLCDEFYCTDGLPLDKSPLYQGNVEDYDVTAPDLVRFENRDPRLKATLMVPGMEWNGKVYDYVNTKMAAVSTCAIRKWFTPNDTANEYDGSLDFYIIRYAEVLLSLAEAMIEKGGYSQSEITKHINEVRARVGMPAVEDVEGTGLSQEQLRAIVRHERRVELAFEDLRFADLYRWGEWENNVKRMQRDETVYGINYSGYSRTYRGAQDEVWPIPRAEIDSNSKLEQHKEWK
ncbi:RagB/SusD family nutrient uptake outer membrane protein [Bacteroides sp. 519]|uniref:RagB/SusD family nutrient uptake outer membrane protein n=1 Tax=Bacteroides sp. 519 TaxID=2302937 RepID=UPI0013D24BE0|nr:RagB/SusD family nutrient uptake outer membrane protein [Bacteroides sp. 519]NDV60456.1 RagB/SusD family nutrient uptake outer membrane protein [Bacteroides sp. 519]